MDHRHQFHTFPCYNVKYLKQRKRDVFLYHSDWTEEINGGGGGGTRFVWLIEEVDWEGSESSIEGTGGGLFGNSALDCPAESGIFSQFMLDLIFFKASGTCNNKITYSVI